MMPLRPVLARTAWRGSIRSGLDRLRSPLARWGIPVIGAVLATLMASLWQVVWPARHTAISRVVIDPSVSGAAGPAWVAAQVQILRSERVARRVAADADAIAGLAGFPWGDDRQAAAHLLSGLAVEVSAPGGLISVRYTSENPAVAARVADAFVDAYQSVSQDMRRTSVAALRQRAQNDVAGLRDSFEQARARLTAIERASTQGAALDLAQTVRVARMAPAADWSGLPGERPGPPDRSPLDGLYGTQSHDSVFDTGAVDSLEQFARRELQQAGAALTAAQERLSQIDDLGAVRPTAWVLDRAEVPDGGAGTGARLSWWGVAGLLTTALLRQLAMRMDRRVDDVDALARAAGVAVFGLLRNVEAPARAPRRLPRPFRKVVPGARTAPALP